MNPSPKTCIKSEPVSSLVCVRLLPGVHLLFLLQWHPNKSTTTMNRRWWWLWWNFKDIKYTKKEVKMAWKYRGGDMESIRGALNMKQLLIGWATEHIREGVGSVPTGGTYLFHLQTFSQISQFSIKQLLFNRTPEQFFLSL